jgi:acyl-CoA synthetase (AMP-forming)/AMP-acid ligase II
VVVHFKLIAEAQELFDDLNIKTVLLLPGDDQIKEVLKEASTDLNIIEIDVNHAISSDTPAPPVNLDNGVALYLHTSGTTGKPKAVPLRHSNLIRGAKNVAETYDLSSKDRTYLLQVLFHIHGIIAALLAPLITGGSIVIPKGGKLNAACAWSDFANQKCNWVTGTPSILQTLLAAPADPVPDIRFIRSCSSPLLPTVFNALRERFSCPIIEAYAMTEASHQMCSNRLDLFASGTVGPESGTTKVCIWGGGEQASQLGQEGEVSVCGENVMGGYEGVSPEKNKEAFWHGTDERGHEAEWFRTGDRGVLSTDGHRRLTLIGRLSEMVNRGGEKISPVEVDEAMMLVADDVKEAASFSVPDEFYGQEIEAAVVLKDGSKMDEASLQSLLESRLAKFKIPKRIHFCEGAIPKGTSYVTCTICKENMCANMFFPRPYRQDPAQEFDSEICHRRYCRSYWSKVRGH